MLKDRTEKYIKDHQTSGNAHLLSALEYELEVITKLTNKLKSPDLANPTYSEWLKFVHNIEEELFYHSNKIEEELEHIQHALKITEINQNIIQLLMVARNLIPKAQETLSKHAHAREAPAIKHQLKELELLVTKLENHHEIDELFKIEQQLRRIDETLKKLLQIL